MDGGSRHVVVTGAARGIGFAVASAFASAGHKVTLLGRSQATLEAAVAELGGGTCVVADVTDPEALERALGAAADQAPVDILVSNAGAAESAPLARTDADMLRRMMAVNVEAALTGANIVLPGMVERGFGRIINVASTAGLKGYAYVSAYCAAKHAVVGLTRAMAVELARTGVTVNAVCPGYTDTDLVRDAVERLERRTGREGGQIVAEMTRANPQGRLMRPEEVADAVLWLAGPGASGVTGQAIAVAGGEV